MGNWLWYLREASSLWSINAQLRAWAELGGVPGVPWHTQNFGEKIGINLVVATSSGYNNEILLKTERNARKLLK
jgi:hypothetical protein